MGLIRKVADEHCIAVVMAMHDLNMAMRHADRTLFSYLALGAGRAPTSPASAKPGLRALRGKNHGIAHPPICRPDPVHSVFWQG
jgi:ABC-type hemin transport system ATPase subunit